MVEGHVTFLEKMYAPRECFNYAEINNVIK